MNKMKLISRLPKNQLIRMNTRELDFNTYFKATCILLTFIFFIIMFIVRERFGFDSIFNIISDNTVFITVIIMSTVLTTIPISISYYFHYVKPNLIIEPVNKMIEKKANVYVEDVIIDGLVVVEGEKIEEDKEYISLKTNKNNNPFIKKTAIPTKAKLNEKDNDIQDLYTFDDLQFNFQTDAGFLLAGRSGAGKSILAYNVIDKINKDTNYTVQYLINDFGERDFDNSVGGDLTTFKYTLELMMTIMKGRQKDKSSNFTRIFWILEEAESMFESAKAELPAKEYKALMIKMSNLARMGRKLDISLCLIVQAGKAGQVDSTIKVNLPNKFIMDCPKIISTKVFELPHDLSKLAPGIAYYDKADAFVQTELIGEPAMNTLDLTRLEVLSNMYKRKYGIGENNE